MKIGIDARLINQTGVGRYIKNLIINLEKISKSDDFYIYVNKDDYDSLKLQNPKFTKKIVNVKWHSLKEQIAMPMIFKRDMLDLVHIPYFNYPIFYSGRTVITIHDLTILHYPTGKATRLPKLLYNLKRIGYLLTLNTGLKKSKHIITVSEATKNDIVKNFSIIPEKISVTYEGVDFNIIKSILASGKRLIKDKYFLYVGNAYPHKNLEFLIRSFRIFWQKNPEYKLVLVGPDDYFYHRLKKYADGMEIDPNVIFWGQAGDAELGNLYKYAAAFIFPSLFEGFGLPALESLAIGTRLVVSDIDVFRELFAGLAIFFNPNIEMDLVEKMEQTSKSSVPSGKFDISIFDWEKLAVKTLKIYRAILYEK